METNENHPPLEAHLYIFYQVKHAWNNFENFLLPVTEADPATFLDCSLAGNGAVCCTMTGSFYFVVDGKPWLRYWGDEEEDSSNPAGFPWNAMSTTLCWGWAAWELLLGRKKVEIGPHDDEPPVLLTRDRHGQVRYAIEDGVTDAPTVPLQRLAASILAEEVKFLRFIAVVLGLIEARLQQDGLPPKTKRGLQERKAHIQSWQLQKQIEGLAKILEEPTREVSWIDAWEYVQELIQAYPPRMEQVILLDEDRGGSIIKIVWTNLPSNEHPFLEGFANHPQASKPFQWESPFQRHPKQHHFEGLETVDGEVRLCLWAKPRKARGSSKTKAN